MKSPLIVILVLLLFITPVFAYERITQGSTVYVGEHYDVAGATGWCTQIAYYGRYVDDPTDMSPVQIYDLPGLTHTSKESQYYYWIDPAKFGQYPGMWYQYYGNISGDESHGNLEVFYVDTVKPFWINDTAYTTPPSNVTVVNMTPQLPLPDKHIADYLIARGDVFNISVDQNTNAWLFGRINGLYNYQSSGGEIIINESLVRGFEPGSYTVLLQTMKDPNGYFTVSFDRKTNEIKYFDAGSFTVNRLNIDGFSPQVTLEKLKQIFPSSKDYFELKKLEIQDPALTISRIDRIYVSGKSVLDICGYTNVAPGTKIWLIWDEEKQTPRTLPSYNFTGAALGNFDGNMRQYRIIMPFDPENTPDGIHPITARTEIGGYAVYDLPVFSYPADSYKPNETVRYIADRNPWVPTPTPEVITVKEKVTVIQTVTVKVSPPDSQVKAQQQIIFNEWVDSTLKLILGIVGFLVICGYGLHVWKKGQKFKKR
jgi:hypothetical protein